MRGTQTIVWHIIQNIRTRTIEKKKEKENKSFLYLNLHNNVEENPVY